MKKSIVAVVTAVVLMINLAGCGKKSQHDVYKEIYKRYNEMQSFYAEVNITVQNEKMSSEYIARQFYESPDRFSVVVDSPEEVAGSGYTAKDGKYTLKSGFGDEKVLDIVFPNEKNTIFVCDFFEEYYKNEETFLETSGGITGKTTTLGTYLGGGNPKRFMQSLEIDNKTYLPLTLTTYDIDKNPVVVVKFCNFIRNAKPDQSLFD